MIKRFLAAAGAIFACAVMIVVFVPAPPAANAQFGEQQTWGGTSTGSANAQAITIPNYFAHKPGVVLRFIPGFTNTGPTQINVSGLGLVNVARPSSIGNVAFSGGEFQAGELTCVVYTGSTYQLGCNVDVTPIGKTVEFRGSATPRGTLIEDGSCVSRATYAPLFSVIGTTYGACDGSTTFQVPDSRGTIFAALDNQGSNGAANRITSAGSGCTATAVGLCGAQNQTLTASQIPSISSTGSASVTVTSTVSDVFFSNQTALPASVGGANPVQVFNAAASTSIGSLTSAGTGSVSASSTNTGGGAHPILNPILLGRRAIKY